MVLAEQWHQEEQDEKQIDATETEEVSAQEAKFIDTESARNRSNTERVPPDTPEEEESSHHKHNVHVKIQTKK